MTNGKLRLGMVGLGTWARTGHLPVYFGRRLAGLVEVAALCSRSRERAERWSREFGVPLFFDDMATMLDQARLDIVAVCTADRDHTPYVLAAQAAGCHVLVEKPLATQLDECAQVMRQARQSPGQVITLFHKRADPLWMAAADRIRAGAYGHLQMGVCSIQNPISVPAGSYFASDLAARSDPNWFLGTHFYDLIRYMTGLDPVEVRAHGYKRSLPEHGIDTLDALKADLLLAGGATLSVLVSWNLPPSSPSLTRQDMRLHFSDGELLLDGTHRGFVADGPTGYADVNPYFMHPTAAGPVGYGATFLEEAILQLLNPGQASPVVLPTLADAWWATAVAEAVEHSVATGGQPVRVAAPPD